MGRRSISGAGRTEPVLLEWWATWCEQCDVLLPRLLAARNEVGDAWSSWRSTSR
jgi:thioredoxin-like negative regulator of GroEL